MVGKDFQKSKHKRTMKEKIDNIFVYIYILLAYVKDIKECI